MKIQFYKYQGTGNDFVMIDDREKNLPELTTEKIKSLCDRRFGIGADGLILVRPSKQEDFEMVYFNSDGRQSSMCGNGGRCILRFVHDLDPSQENYSFTAIDGLHYGMVNADVVSLQMKNVSQVESLEDGAYFIDTGSPHHIVFADPLPQDDFIDLARKIRHSEKYEREGVNVNFIRTGKKGIEMRTFERGVEDETLSCGTGVTAAALAAYSSGKISGEEVKVLTAGGKLSVTFKKKNGQYFDIWLTGPAEMVFKGKIEI